MHLLEAGKGSERHGVVAAQDDRDIVLRGGLGHERRDPLACGLDLRQEAGVLVPDRRGFGDCGLDVPPVHVLEPELADPAGQAGVPDRGGPHVDAATALAKVQSCADRGHLAGKRLQGHLQQG